MCIVCYYSFGGFFWRTFHSTLQSIVIATTTATIRAAIFCLQHWPILIMLHIFAMFVPNMACNSIMLGNQFPCCNSNLHCTWKGIGIRIGCEQFTFFIPTIHILSLFQNSSTSTISNTTFQIQIWIQWSCSFGTVFKVGLKTRESLTGYVCKGLRTIATPSCSATKASN